MRAIRRDLSLWDLDVTVPLVLSSSERSDARRYTFDARQEIRVGRADTRDGVATREYRDAAFAESLDQLGCSDVAETNSRIPEPFATTAASSADGETDPSSRKFETFSIACRRSAGSSLDR